VSALVILLAGCKEPMTKFWGEDGRFSITPASWGKSLWSRQDTYYMSGFDGKLVWQKTLDGVKWIRTLGFGRELYLVADDRILVKIDIDGNILWKWEASEGQLIYPFATSKKDILCAFDSNASYNQNPVSIVAVDIKDGKTSWTLDDHDYAGILTIEPVADACEHFVVPNVVGDSVFLEGFQSSDGKFLWRKNWDKPPSGQHPILANDSKDCWIWKKTTRGVDIGLMDKKTGTIGTTSIGVLTSSINYKNLNDYLYVKFQDGFYRFDKNMSVTNINSSWFPVCQVPGTDKLVVQNRDCTSLGVSDASLSDVTKTFPIKVCYDGIPGWGFGEVYVMPKISPFDFRTYRFVVANEKLNLLLDLSNKLANLNRGTSLADITLTIYQITR
jgi:hypothetical protein